MMTSTRELVTGLLSGTGLILLCVHEEETLVCRVDLLDLFSDLVDRICAQWKNLQKENVSLYYSMPEVPKCVLTNESDFQSMIRLAGSFGLERVRVDVCCGVGNSMAITDCNGILRDVENVFEDDTVDSFYPTQIKTLKTVGWDNLVAEVGQKYEGGAREFRLALAKSSIEGEYEFKYVKNDSSRITAVCSSKETTGCDWNVHATVELCNGFFYVRRINNIHTCGVSFRTLKQKRMGSELISSLIVDEVRGQKNTRPVEVVRHIGRDYGLNVSYHNAWVGVEKAKKIVYGDQNDSFDSLRAYVDEALKSNPGSCICLEVDQSSRCFRRLFVCFKACIDGFNHCRPLLFLDGTHLKGKFKGHLLSATGKDGNQGLYPLAFCVVDSEDLENWAWFLGLLKGVLDRSRKVVFISDRNLGLLGAMKRVFPDSPHGHCLNHLKMNLRSHFSGRRFSKGLRSRLVWLLKKCAYAPTVQMYNEHMKKLIAEGGFAAQEFFDNLEPKNWANAYFTGARYGEMSSNAAESFNNWILEERELPITNMIDAIRIKIMKLFFDRRSLCKTWNTAVCPAIESKLSSLMGEARGMGVVGSYDMTFEVQCVPAVAVDLVDRTCSCRQWQIKGLPCCHAIACVLSDGTRPLACFVDKYFHVTSYASSYASAIHPVLTANSDGDAVVHDAILPPKTKRMPGRPRKKRIPSKGEFVSSLITCGRCGRLGNHNKKSCNVPL